MYNKRIFQNCFCYPKRYWYMNIKQIPRYFGRIHRLIKYGYDDYAVWDTFSWFVETMRDILKRYKQGHCGFKIVDWTRSEDENEQLWEDTIDKMLALLDDMDENNEKYDCIQSQLEIDKQMESAKDEFFKLFSEHFYDLWD